MTKGNKDMKIVINALQYQSQASGIAIFMRELFGKLAGITDRQIQIIIPRGGPPLPDFPKECIVEAPCRYDEGKKRILFQTLELGKQYCENAVLLAVDSKVPARLPHSSKLLPLITDLALYRMPETYQKSRELLWKWQYRTLSRRADHFFAISEFTKQEMTEILGIAPDRTDIIPCAVSEQIQRVDPSAAFETIRSKYGVRKQYILFVGNYNPRKNLDRLIRAFDRLAGETKNAYELVIAGGQGWKFSPEKTLADIKHKKAIRFIGYVPDEDMSMLYSAAEVFAFPTLYEGFGIPVLEAQKCGVPVLTSNTSALPDTAGEAALLVDPYDEQSIENGMRQLLTNQSLRKDLSEKGYRNAERFSWEASARKLNGIIEQTVQ